ncbi:MAG: 50S ribosomal protein L35 [Thermomicrobiales bacterium]|nr:50S ribosomal protein L35 [Thermomicrobiales bacterium]
MANKAKKTKLKTHKGAARRFKITASGKIMHAKGMKSHLRRKKAPRVKRQFDRMQEMNDATVKRVKRMLPNGLK